jgi:hypothetical protein
MLWLHEHNSDRIDTVASSWRRWRILLWRPAGGRRYWRASSPSPDSLFCFRQSVVIRAAPSSSIHLAADRSANWASPFRSHIKGILRASDGRNFALSRRPAAGVFGSSQRSVVAVTGANTWPRGVQRRRIENDRSRQRRAPSAKVQELTSSCDRRAN